MKNRFLFNSLILLTALVCLISRSDGVHLPEVSKVELNKETATVRKTETISLSATVYPDDLGNTPVTWSTSDKTIATVDKNGLVTGVAGGQATITATAGNKSASCVVSVEVPVTGIALDASYYPAYYLAGVLPEQLSVIISPEDATNKNVIWSTSDASRVTVSSEGVVEAQEVGATATITVTTEDGSFTASCEVESIAPVAVDFYPNGGSGSAYEQWVPNGHAKALIPNAFERSGYYFLSWNTDAGGAGVSYADGAEITATGATTLYAQWNSNPVVTFYGNYASGGSMAPQSVPYNTPTALTPNGYTRNGYTFTGWNTNEDGTGESFENGASVTITDNLSLYAQWKIDAQNNPLTIKTTAETKVTFSNGEYYSTTLTYQIYNGDSYRGEGTVVLNDENGHSKDVTVPLGHRIKIFADRTTFDRLNIKCDQSCYVFGNVMSLISSTGYSTLTNISFMSAFNSLFMDNTNIDIDPKVGELVLPATTLSEGCYYYMFAGCTSLTRAPEELPASTLAYSCYDNMFRDCVSLEHSPVLPATSLTSNSYYQMFLGCENLKSITCLATDIGSFNCIEGWVDGVHAGTGDRIFYKDPSATCWQVGNNVPTGWTIKNR